MKRLFNLYKNPKTKKRTLWTTNKWDSWINIYIQDPLATWKQVKEYFKKPKISFRICRVKKTSGYPYASYHWIGKILDINIKDVQWKDKWNSPRHERNPLIWICIFRCIAFTINFNIYYEDEFGEQRSGDMEYWEYILDYLYYKDKKTLRCYSAWMHDSKLYRKRIFGKAEDGSDDTFKPCPCIVPCVAMSLNKEGVKKLKEELKNEQNS